MKHKVIFKDLGNIDYKEAWDYQQKLFDEIVEMKRNNEQLTTGEQAPTTNYLLFCEHPHVYTLGKSGSENNLLINHIQLKANNATFYKIDRGGDITYHGPGQIVGYPILNLEYFVKGAKEYIFKIEEAIIRTLNEYGIEAGRLKGAIGVWLDPEVAGKARKICAIGVKTSRWVSMHGFAFNINTGLNYFDYINPCGYTDKQVTSLEKELGAKQDMEQVKEVVKEKLAQVFEFELE
ncbi:MAG: lipoyl(octanoyl) transferase LipB [Bacteroidales bacterium]|nr:lipoyl(octanoyl) transferase LipB [Bacteroidales bacterium]